jgi:hypothetical protein
MAATINDATTPRRHDATTPRRHDADGQCPAEHGDDGVTEGGEARDGQRERTESGEVVEADEDEGADAGGHYGRRCGRCVLDGQAHGQNAESAADGDEGCLGTEDRAAGQGGQRGEGDAHERDELDGAACLEAFGWLVARRTGYGGD